MRLQRYVGIFFFSMLFIFLAKHTCTAVPAYTGKTMVTQPNGSTFYAKLNGDESRNWTTTADSNSVIVKDKDGYWKYAEISFGQISPTDAKVAIDVKPLEAIDSNTLINTGNVLQEQSIVPKKYYSSGEPDIQSSIAPSSPGSSHRILVLLVSFTDATIQNSESVWSNYYFSNSSNSVNKYYQENSGGGFGFLPASENYGTPNDGVVKVTLARAHPNTAGASGEANRQVVLEALTAANPYVDFASYDTNHNGYIDINELHISTVLAGYEKSAGSSVPSPSVWAHHSALYGSGLPGDTNVVPPTLDGVCVCHYLHGGYTQMGEIHTLLGNHMATIGTACHELGHDLGLPDEYNTTDSSDPVVGLSSLMAGGSWGTSNYSSGGKPGDLPTHLDPWSKTYLGFVTPTVVSAGTQNVNCVTTGNYNVLKIESPTDPNQYFLVENRNFSGFDKGLNDGGGSFTDAIQSGGIAVWHIDESILQGWITSHQRINNNPAHRGIDVEVATDYNYPYFGSNGKNNFNDSTTPNSKFYGNLATNIKVKVLDPAGTSMRVQIGDPVGVGFSAANYYVNENAGSITIPVTRTDSSGTLSVDYTTSDDSANAGSDYTEQSGTLTFLPGDLTKNIVIPINDDTIYEGNIYQKFLVTLSNATSGTIGISNATVQINDNDLAPFFSFSPSTYQVNESDGTITLTITKTRTSESPISVGYTTSNGTATAGSDYTAASGTIIFNGSEMSKTVTINITNDSTHEDDETFNVSLGVPAYCSVVTGTAVVTINDDDPAAAEIAISPASKNANENAGIVTFTVTRTDTTDVLTVDYATVDGTATAGNDYTATSGTLTFNSGEGSKTITVPILDDGSYEGNENFRVNLSNASSGTITGATANVTITEDDQAPQIAFSPTSYSVAENGGSIDITVNRTQNSVGVLTVNYTITNGTATAGSDYSTDSGVYSGTLTFADGETSKTIRVNILDDITYEANENFTVTLSGTSIGTITAPTTTVTITEDDPAPAQISFNPVTYSIGEGGGSITLNIKRAVDTTSSVTVDFSTVNGTATAGSDYVALSGTVTFAPGETDKTITITINDDSDVELNETFKVKLSNPTGGAILVSDEATVTITENDGLAPAGTIVKVDWTATGGTIGCNAGSTQTLTVYAVYENGAMVDITSLGTWYSSESDVATVSNGVITGYASGVTDITFTYNGKSYTFSYTVN